MNEKDTKVEIEKLSSVDFVEESELPDIDEIQDSMPHINVSLHGQESQLEEEKKSIISDDELIGIYSEIMNCIREDRKQASDFIDTMAEMVINDGDATSSSKEALVNLVKIKSDMSDKMGKIADLMTRVKIKEKDTFPKYLAANQNNTININEGTSRRSLIEAINKAKKDKE